MNKFVIALALAALIASPALAKSAKHHNKHPSRALSAYAQSQPYALFPSDAVIASGRVVGADPDPQVRLNIRRDPWQR